MTKRLLILGAWIAVVLATAAGPALADGQSATGSLVTVQVGSASASPDTANPRVPTIKPSWTAMSSQARAGLDSCQRVASSSVESKNGRARLHGAAA